MKGFHMTMTPQSSIDRVGDNAAAAGDEASAVGPAAADIALDPGSSSSSGEEMHRNSEKKSGKSSKGHGSVARHDAELAAALAAYRVDAPELSPVIHARAYTSGDYPYEKKPKRKVYDRELRDLQIELLKLQEWVKHSGERIVVVFEGRDAAGKGGTIHRVVQHLNPRFVRVVALGTPTDIERAQWYFQRYIAHLPHKGEIVLFDRSWYNRAVIEPVMGFCSPQETAHFLGQAPIFEKMLVDDGIRLFKIWLDIGREMQLKRLHDRHVDPLKRWKLSPVDLAAPSRWDAITAARTAMIVATHTAAAPWTVARANDKMRARLGVIRHLLAHIPYAGRDDAIVGVPDPAIMVDGRAFVEDEYGEFERRPSEAR